MMRHTEAILIEIQNSSLCSAVGLKNLASCINDCVGSLLVCILRTAESKCCKSFLKTYITERELCARLTHRLGQGLQINHHYFCKFFKTPP